MSIKPIGYVSTDPEAYERTRESLDNMCTARTKPIVYPEYPKCMGTHIWEISEGVFDFTDATENFSGTQYPSIEAAKAGLEDYCYWLDQINKEVTEE